MIYEAGRCANFHCIPQTAYVIRYEFCSNSAIKQA